MKRVPERLLDIIYHYYPRGNDPNLRETVEYARLADARKRAGVPPDYERWKGTISRVQARFPDCRAENWSFHLPTGQHDACYRGELTLPGADIIGFYVSFLAPFYVIYKRLPNDDADATLELSPTEQIYANGVAEEIQHSYPEHAPLLVQSGGIRVRDVALETGAIGTATIYDLLFSQRDRLVLDDEERRERIAFLKAYRKLQKPG